MEMLLPDGWKRPKGYTNGVLASGPFIFTAGMIGWNSSEAFDADDIVGQARRVFENIIAVLSKAGAGPADIVQMTWFVTDMEEYRANLKPIGAVWREVMGAHYPAIACVEVSRLVEPRAKIEITAIAAAPR